jgi:hypothetical protein
MICNMTSLFSSDDNLEQVIHLVAAGKLESGL